MTRSTGILPALLLPILALGQGGDQQVRAKADQLFAEQRFAEAMPLYSQLVSLSPSDRALNYRFGACLLFGSADKEPAVGHLKFATEAPDTDPIAWYWLGRAYHLNYRFKEAQVAYQRFLGTADKKLLAQWPVEALQRQCRNGEKLLSNLKEINVRSKVEVADADFFRFYELSDIGGRLVVLPDELKTSLDKKRKHRSLVYLPQRNGPIYFSSYGKDGATGLDIYRTELLPDGTYAVPAKLAGYINTDQDEDFPFMHPDGRTFYFCSKGHNSMGGYDVFRASYDRGLDAFGRPENLDFAISTPDDDILYIVDAEQKEACFASGRDSKQGMLHVYRVGTAQAPVMITAFKGTYASTIDKDDRKARIVVEDMLTQEQVADVRTDINGNYVLSVPRAGRYRYRVECGPTGKTHGGVVEVPKADGPRAYRQELILDRKGDLEQLTIRNYFDAPLSEDMVALALDEIKRRARLDVSTREVVADRPAPGPQQPERDLLTRAGFTGDVDEARAVQLAKEDARELEAQALDQQAMAAEAFTLALDAANEAEKATAKADELLQRAAAASEDEAQRNALMTEAAVQRQRAREATLRARAAHNTGTALAASSLTTRQKAAEAAKLSADLNTAIEAKQDDRALTHLQALKKRLDEKSKADAASDPAEQARRQLAEQEKEAARQMAIAKAKRDEENEVADQVARLKRERDEARSKPKKEEVERRLTELEQQQRYLREETQAAVRKAEAAERQTAIARGQASLTRHLAQTSERGAASELSPEQVQQLGLRISGTDQRAAALAIDERYDAMVLAERPQVEARAFDWDLVSAAQAIGEHRAATQAMDRSGANDAQRASGRQVPAPQAKGDEAALRQAKVEQPPDTAGREERLAEQAPEQPAADEDRTADPIGAEASAADATVPVSNQATEARGNATQVGNALRSGNAAQPDGAGQNANAAQASDAAQTGNAAQQGAASLPGTEQTASTQAGTNVSSRSTAGVEASRPIAAKGGEANSPDETVAITADQNFMLENERAELAQLASAERDRAKRQELQQRIAAIDERLAQADAMAGAPETEPALEADMSRPLITFTASAKEDEIVAQVYRDYAADLMRAERMADADARADAINGIELMLADSLRAEMQRQVAVLQLAPQQAEEVLPRVDRLRRMREEHLARGEQALAQRQYELAGANAAPAPVRMADQPTAATSDRINERYVAIDRYARNVYGSKVEHRSRAKGVDDAVAFLQADQARIEELSARIDSMERQLAGMPLGKESDRLRKKADQLIDERYIIRTDMGQRSAFLMREEWKAAADSLKKVEAASTRKGLSPDEPLLRMAKEYGTEAKDLFDGAAQLRKRADRSEDIVLRDSLYRRAYRDELLALQAMDRAITVQNHLASDGLVRGEQLTYEEVAARVLRLDAQPAEPLMAQQAAAEAVRSESLEAGVTQQPQAPGPSEALEAQPQAPVVAGTEPVVQQQTTEARGVGDQRTAQREARLEQATWLTVAQRAEERAPAASTGNPAHRSTAAAPGTGAAEPAAVSRDVSPAAEQTIAQAEGRLKEKDRVPAGLYERFLTGESVELSPGALDADSDPDLLAIRSEEKLREAQALEQRSQQAADRANAMADSALSARRRDRERLTLLSVRERSLSDSLHTASVKAGAEAAELLTMSLEAEKVARLRDRLVKYYYLTPEEQRLTLLDGDASRFFQAKALAMEQLQASEDASGAARSNREVALVLRQQARAAEREAVNGRLPAAEATSKALLLDARALQLELRADSLDNVASRLRGAAGINEAQAGVMLQAMPAERSSELMALEQRARRNEALLAQLRDQAAPARVQAAVRLDRPTIRPAQSGQANAGASVATDQPAFRAADSGEPAARPEPARPAEGIGTAPMADQARGVDVLPFRMPDELVEDIFTLNAPTARREAPIPMDVELPSGIVFKVQIGAFRNQVPQEAFSDMTPVMGESVGNGLVRYTAGLFTGFDGAAAAKDLVRERGYRDAFVVAYRDGKRIPLGEAMRATQQSSATAQAPIRMRGVSEEPAPRVAESAVAAAPPAMVIKQPVAAGQPAAEAEDAAAILARYPASAQQILESFAPAPEATAYYNVPGAAPAMQVEAIKGLFFTVQVGVYSRPVPLDKLFNITPLNSELTESAKVRYTTGRYRDLDGARARKDEAVGLGVKDAFITAYLNGRRIPVREATALLQQFGPAILAQP